MVYHVRARTDSGHRELQATIDEKERTRMTSMIKAFEAVAAACGPNNLEFRK